MFEIGQRVRTRAQRDGHTRLPGYLQRCDGEIVRVLGEFRFADDGAVRGANAEKQPLYTVSFDRGTHRVCADLFEPYLEAR